MTLHTDIHLTFISIRGLISSGQDYLGIPSRSSHLWAFILADCCCDTHLPKGCVYPIKGSMDFSCLWSWLLSLTSGALQELTFACLSEFVSLKLSQSFDLPADSEIGIFPNIPYSAHFALSCVTYVVIVFIFFISKHAKQKHYKSYYYYTTTTVFHLSIRNSF